MEVVRFLGVRGLQEVSTNAIGGFVRRPGLRAVPGLPVLLLPYLAMIVLASTEVSSDAGPFALISQGGVIQGPVKELRKNVHQLKLTLQFQRAI